MAHRSSRTARPQPVVVFDGDELGRGDDSHRLSRIIPAGIISLLIHMALIPLLYVVKVNEIEAVETDSGIIETDTYDISPPSFTPDDLGDIGNPSEGSVELPKINILDVPSPTVGNSAAADDEKPLPVLPKNADRDQNKIGLPPADDTDKPLRGRMGKARQNLIIAQGGNVRSEAAVEAGLRWLAEHQAPDGHWSLKEFTAHGKCACAGSGGCDSDIAATALGLLPFLGVGETHKSGTDKQNKYVKIVDRGLKYLINKQVRDGAFDLNMYAHGLATIAVCEAYGLSSDPVLRGPAQRALNYIIKAQSDVGGWRYQAGQPGYDTSIGGWELMALKSGQMAGLDVPKKTMTAAGKWLDAAAVPDGGAYGYTTPGEGTATTAVGLLCREYLGWGPRSPGLIAGVKRLDKWGPSSNSMYYNYYGTQVMHHLGGASWDKWNVKMRDQLIDTQDDGKTKPHQKGSWFNKDDAISSVAGGRVMATSLSLLTLEIYYRHMPLYRRGVLGDKD